MKQIKEAEQGIKGFFPLSMADVVMGKMNIANMNTDSSLRREITQLNIWLDIINTLHSLEEKIFAYLPN